MCYKVSKPDSEKANRILKKVTVTESEFPDFTGAALVSGFERPDLPVILQKNQKYIPVQATWGLLPFWAANKADAQKIAIGNLNARSETIFEKASFKNAILHGRCIVLTNGFYENQTIGKNKQPYFIYPAEGDILFLAGIIEYHPDHSFKPSVSIITCEGNNLMKNIHNSAQRMPVILNPDRMIEWLHPDIKENDIQNYLTPCPDEFINAHMVNPRINSLHYAESGTSVCDVWHPQMTDLFGNPA
jgi:putative SOS response-associated peptidase YedK